jgi:CubicO group peptidase (beta-lactamase class C family)
MIFQQIDTYLQSQIDEDGIPGISIAITLGKEIIYNKAFGVANIDTNEKLEPWHIFHVASVSKPFVATAVMQLVEREKINIDEPLATYLPYFEMNDVRFKSITVKQILNHTSGMPDVEDYGWGKGVSDDGAAERYTRSLIDKKLLSTPGKEYHYSNMAYDVMADLISKVSGLTFEEYVKENILEPLKMYDSSFFYPEIKDSLRTSPHVNSPPTVSPIYPYNRMHAPSSTLNSNVIELSHWAIANIHKGCYRENKILKPTTHEMMTTPTFKMNRDNMSIGLGWRTYTYQGLVMVEHAGADLGYKSWITLIPEKQLGIIILSNTEEIDMFNARNTVRDLLLSSDFQETK